MTTPTTSIPNRAPRARRSRRTWTSWILSALAGFAACSFSAPSRDEAPVGPVAPALDPHYLPAAQVAVPVVARWRPRPVVEPANPIAHTAPLHNPGGVDGNRPPRSAPELVASPAARPLVTQDVMPDRTGARTAQPGAGDAILGPAAPLAPGRR